MFKPLDVGRRKKTDLLPKMVCGFYVGHHQRTGAVLCMTEKGVQRGRGVSRLPEAERWVPLDIPNLVGMPWNLGYREKITHGIVGASEVSPAPVPDSDRVESHGEDSSVTAPVSLCMAPLVVGHGLV